MKETLLALFAQLFSSISVIVSKAIQQFLRLGFAFKGWTYAITSITFIPKHLLLYLDLESITCFDTNCRVILVNKNQLFRHLLSQKISTISISLKIREIRASKYKYKSAKFVVLSLYFLGKDNIQRLVYVSIGYKIHLLKELRVNLLIDNNILSPKSFIIDIGRKNTLIQGYMVTIPINTKQ